MVLKSMESLIWLSPTPFNTTSWIRQDMVKVNPDRAPMGKRFYMFPENQNNNHWRLLIWDRSDGLLWVYDSLNGTSGKEGKRAGQRQRSCQGDKASLVKVVGIVVEDPIRGFDVLDQRKPLANCTWIFTFDPLVVFSSNPACTKCWLALDEAGGPVLPNRVRDAYAYQVIGHIFHISQPRRKCTRC